MVIPRRTLTLALCVPIAHDGVSELPRVKQACYTSPQARCEVERDENVDVLLEEAVMKMLTNEKVDRVACKSTERREEVTKKKRSGRDLRSRSVRSVPLLRAAGAP